MSDIQHKAQVAQVELEADAVKTRLARAQHELSGVRRRVTTLETELTDARAILDRFSMIKPEDMRVPKWTKTKARKRGGAHHATPVLMLSDLHLDEVVDLHVMDGINQYDRPIAERRLHAVVENVVKLLKRYVAGVEFDGLFVALLGDVITGVIHDELARTNEAPPSASIAHWVPLLASALVYLADELDVPVHVAAVDGNHDRFYGKPHHKQRAETSLAWIIYNWLADTLRSDPRITFALTTAAEQVVTLYDTRLMLSHGDSFRSQGGVGGLYPSLLKWLLRRHQMYTQTKADFDFALIGHWHSTLSGQDFFVNGSLKGYDEYAKALGFTYEAPAQTLFLVTPERGVTLRLSVAAD